ncbi:helix-turn-helix domain-containing protein [Thalassococcus sp. BH17M4-6]|uniref:helix-turn-helix domain-containing protein n=1 Tax=Thalassococcus sp. BH17M4-6 TaxID=3413148 RepID=UPI003BBDA202
MKLSSEEIDRHVGAKLRFLREANGLSQAALAGEVGVTFQQVQKYEQGSNRISASKLWQFCEVLNVTPNNFFEGIDEELATKQNHIPRKVAETAWHLHQLKDAQIKHNMLELIRLCQGSDAKGTA